MSTGTTPVHPHVTALSQVAKEILILSDQLETLLSHNAESSHALVFAKHGLMAPFTLTFDFLRDKDQLMNFQQYVNSRHMRCSHSHHCRETGVDLLKNWNILIKELLCYRLEFTRSRSMGLTWRYQFLLSASDNASDEALLLVLPLDANGVPVQVIDVILAQ